MTKKRAALEALRKAGALGVHSYDMRQIAGLQAPVRIKELRDEGYEITSPPEHRGNTTGCRYTLISEPGQRPSISTFREETGDEVDQPTLFANEPVKKESNYSFADSNWHEEYDNG